MSDVIFVGGMIVKAPRSGAPDFLKCQLSLKRLELIKWLGEQEGDWVNVDVKESKAGKWFAAVNTWKPNADKVPASKPDEFEDDEIGF